MTDKKRILLLNPPGKELYIRDYYCSKVSKANYLYHPVDLLILSGLLFPKYDVSLLDAIAENINPVEAEKRILNDNFEVVIFLTGSVSFEEDFSFLSKIKEKRKNILLIGSGDALLDNCEEILKQECWLDAILLDFTSKEILDYLEKKQKTYNTIHHQKGGEIFPATEERERGEFTIPIPRHDLFPHDKYIYPFVREAPFTTVLTDYGCPYHCSFCVMSVLPYKWRSVQNVIEELEYICSLGIREIYFDDQTFGINPKRTQELCEAMIRSEVKIRWICFSRADLITQELLSLMKEAGCHTIMMGVESGSEEILQKYGKGITKEQITAAFALCKENNIDTVGTFILGLPEEKEEDILATIEFSQELCCDYASFNISIPRMATPVRKEAIENNLISYGKKMMDQSGTYAVMGTKYLTSKRVLSLHNKAVNSFYLRPSYIVKRILHLRSWWDIKRQVGAGISIIEKLFSYWFRK